jgi:PPK2 family polyphosphate:nucleotide phosphotransferase
VFDAPDSPYLVPYDGSFRVDAAPTEPVHDTPGKKEEKDLLAEEVEKLDKLQRRLYASDRFSVLLVFQALDAAGKDGTIRAVMSGVNPQGCQVFSFKQPTAEELDHDFLWRTAMRLPERGRIGIFNRSYYEEVLAVRVHPEYLESQRLPWDVTLEELWYRRYHSIREHEEHLARAGTVILKFWLNVSKEEQRQRLLARIDDEDKNWKFSAGDVKERGFWEDYQAAYEAALNATSRPWAPWYAIPADDKPSMRLAVARIVTQALDSLGLEYPKLSEEEVAGLSAWREELKAEKGS